MKYCKNCGKQLPDEAAFCTGCGANLGGPTGAPQGFAQGGQARAPQGFAQGGQAGAQQGFPQGSPMGTPQGFPLGGPMGMPQGGMQLNPAAFQQDAESVMVSMNAQGQPQGAPGQQWTPNWAPPGFQNRPVTQPKPVAPDSFGTDETTRLTAADMSEAQRAEFEKATDAASLGTDETTRLTAADMPENQKQEFRKQTNASALGLDETTRLTAADMPQHMGGPAKPGGFSHVAGNAGGPRSGYGQEDMTARGHFLASQPVDSGIGGRPLTAQPGQNPVYGQNPQFQQQSGKSAKGSKSSGGKGLVILFAILSVLGAAAIAVFLILGLKIRDEKKDYEEKAKNISDMRADIQHASEIRTGVVTALASEDAYNDACKYGLNEEEGSVVLWIDDDDNSFHPANGMNGTAFLNEVNECIGNTKNLSRINFHPDSGNGDLSWKWYVAVADGEVFVYIGTSDTPCTYQLYPGVSAEYVKKGVGENE